MGRRSPFTKTQKRDAVLAVLSGKQTVSEVCRELGESAADRGGADDVFVPHAEGIPPGTLRGEIDVERHPVASGEVASAGERQPGSDHYGAAYLHQSRQSHRHRDRHGR